MELNDDHGGKIYAAARLLGVHPSDIIDFSASINPLGLSASARKALVESMDDLAHYPDCLQNELKSSLSLMHGVSGKNIALANGSTELIYNLPFVFKGKRALVVAPAFSEYAISLRQHGFQVDYLILSPEDGFAIDRSSVASALKCNYSAIYLCNPGNPTGKLYPREIIEEISSLCSETGTFMVIDEAFIDFCEEESAELIAIKNGNSVVLRSMTKFYGFPGLRLGYAVAAEPLAERLERAGGVWSVNALALGAGVAAVNDREYADRTVSYVAEQRRRLMDRLRSVAALKPFESAANFILVEIMARESAARLQEELLKKRVLIRDCAGFKGLSPSFFRIAVRTGDENDRLAELLSERYE